MSHRKRGRALRRGLVLAALSGLGVLLFALTPGTASAGLPGASTLTVQLQGAGPGNITQGSGPGNGTPNAVNCSKASGSNSPSTGVCVANVPFGEPPQPWIGLVANPPAGSEFAGWTVTPQGTPTSNCGLQATCFVQMNTSVTVRALFNAAPGFPVYVVRAGSAASQGSVTSNPAGINCTPSDQVDCTASFPVGTTVTLTAFPQSGVQFAGWSGTGIACVQGNSGPTCTLPVNRVLGVTATFNTQTFPLAVNVSGQGGVSSNVNPFIECGDSGNTCQQSYASGTQVVLSAVADTGYDLQSWDGACAGAGRAPTCTVTMSQAQTAGANFVLVTVQASVTGNRVRNVGPRRARRVLQVTVDADQEVNIVMRLRRNGVTRATRRVRNFGPDTARINFPLRNGLPAGRYQLQVTFTNDFGASKVQNRRVNLKRAP